MNIYDYSEVDLPNTREISPNLFGYANFHVRMHKPSIPKQSCFYTHFCLECAMLFVTLANHLFETRIKGGTVCRSIHPGLIGDKSMTF